MAIVGNGKGELWYKTRLIGIRCMMICGEGEHLPFSVEGQTRLRKAERLPKNGILPHIASHFIWLNEEKENSVLPLNLHCFRWS
jgi:hypothetical protein